MLTDTEKPNLLLLAGCTLVLYRLLFQTAAGLSPAMALLLFCLLTSLLTVLLIPLQFLDQPGFLRWALLAGTLSAVGIFQYTQEPVQALRSGFACALLTWTLLCVSGLLQRCMPGARGFAGRLVLISAFSLLCSSPVWMSPWLNQFSTQLTVHGLLVTGNPLSLLAGIMQIDWLRTEWLYRHSVLGSLPVQAPATTALAAGYIVVAILCAGLARYCPDRRSVGNV